MIDAEALEKPPGDELLAGAVRGMVSVLRGRGDEHSAYFEPVSAEALDTELRQQFGGVGIRIAREGDPPRVVVVEPPEPGAPAHESGIKARDVILAVDGVDATTKSVDQVAALTRGPVGDPVELTVQHDADQSIETVRLVRAVIRVPSLLGDRRKRDGGWEFRLESDPEVALIRLVTFGDHTGADLRAKLEQLRAGGLRSVLLDLRGNPGGSITAAIDVASLFLPEGAPIVSTRGREGRVEQSYAAASDGPFQDLALLVLIDRDSASASEIVAAALCDNDRATLVGERSYGKGTVQQVIPLGPDRATLKLTSSSYWRPSGVNIHRAAAASDDDPWGVAPDIDVTMTDAERDAWRKWRRTRDLVPLGAEAAEESLGLLEADPVVAAAVAGVGAKR